MYVMIRIMVVVHRWWSVTYGCVCIFVDYLNFILWTLGDQVLGQILFPLVGWYETYVAEII